MNIARITSTSDAGVNFVDDGTAIINPEAGPLPVTLTKFIVSLIRENNVQIAWATSMEINCSKFVIQRSYEGNTFTDIQTIAGNGTTNLFHAYSTTDNPYTFKGGAVYYRLKQIDLDRKQNFSKIISVKVAGPANPEITVSPNPFNDYINVKTTWDQSEAMSVKIFNVQGKEVYLKEMSVSKGVNILKITGLSNLSPGNYYLQLLSANQKIVEKITK